MTDAGISLVRAAKASGEWRKAAVRERDDAVPEDLAKALARNRTADERFRAFAPSCRRAYVYWVNDAKREETRRRRIDAVVERSVEKRKPGDL